MEVTTRFFDPFVEGLFLIVCSVGKDWLVSVATGFFIGLPGGGIPNILETTSPNSWQAVSTPQNNFTVSRFIWEFRKALPPFYWILRMLMYVICMPYVHIAQVPVPAVLMLIYLCEKANSCWFFSGQATQFANNLGYQKIKHGKMILLDIYTFFVK